MMMTTISMSQRNLDELRQTTVSRMIKMQQFLANAWLSHCLRRFLALLLLFHGSESAAMAISWEEILRTSASLILPAYLEL